MAYIYIEYWQPILNSCPPSWSHLALLVRSSWPYYDNKRSECILYDAYRARLHGDVIYEIINCYTDNDNINFYSTHNPRIGGMWTRVTKFSSHKHRFFTVQNNSEIYKDMFFHVWLHKIKFSEYLFKTCLLIPKMVCSWAKRYTYTYQSS